MTLFPGFQTVPQVVLHVRTPFSQIVPPTGCGPPRGRTEYGGKPFGQFADIEQMVNIDLLGPILLTRAAMPFLRQSGDAMVVNIASGIALVGAPFYSTYAAVKAGLAHFGEALRRELKGEGIHVLTAYPGGTDTPMMKTNRAGPELGFSREPAWAVAAAIMQGIQSDAFEVIRGGEVRAQMIALNRNDPAAVDARVSGADQRRESRRHAPACAAGSPRRTQHG